MVPVIEVLAKELNVPISVDTSRLLCEKALNAGAHIVNDVWGLQRILHLLKWLHTVRVL